MQKDLIDKLNKIILKRGLTQQQLAKAIGINQGHLSKILGNKCLPGKKAEHNISTWLAKNTPPSEGDSELLALIKESIGNSPQRKEIVMQIMHNLAKL